MKDIYKSKVDDTIESMETRIKIVKEMVTGEGRAGAFDFDETYLKRA